MADPSNLPTAQIGMLRLTGAMMTDVGMVRPHNEDSVMYRIPGPADSDASRGVLAIVADGMGGHAAGELASQIAARSIHTVYYESDLPIPETLARAFATANLVIRQQAGTDPALTGMGTTCTVLAARDGHLWLGHVGDSRAYMLRAGEMHQLSEDDTLVARLVRDGTMTAEEARNSPERSVLMRALGVHDTVEPMIWKEGLPLRAGDRFVLCSDGLHDLVGNDMIQAAITENPPPEACRILVQAAREAGGHDNISVGVFTVSNLAAQPAASERGTREVKVDDLGGSRT
jgi:protein phosphatase